MVQPKKRRRPLSERWLDFCDQIAFRLIDQNDVRPDQEGIGLLFVAVWRRLGSLLVPKRLSDALRRRRSERMVSEDGPRITGIIDFTEYLVGSFFHQIQTIASWIYKLVVPEKLIKSTERAVVEKSVDTYEDVSSWLNGFGKLLVPSWLRRWMRSWTQTGPMATGYTFLVAWAKSRSLKKLLWGIPVAIFTAPLLGVIAASMVYTPAQKEAHYRNALQQAIDNRDEQAEGMYLEKLAQLGYRQLYQAEFQAAWELSKEEGKWDDAVARMQEIAPLDNPGYVHAHLWLARALIQNKIVAEDKWERIESHAQHTLELSGNRKPQLQAEARLFLARVMERRGQWSQANQALVDLSKEIPTLHFDLLQKAMQSKDQQAVKRHARKVNDVCETLLRDSQDGQESGLTNLQYRAWTLAKQISEGPEAAKPIAEKGLLEYGEDEFLRAWLANSKAQNLIGADLTAPNTLNLLSEIFRLMPKDKTAIKLLQDAARSEPKTAHAIAVALQKTNSIPAAVLLRMGDQRWGKQDAKGALWFYRSAAEVDAQDGAAWNNVAWMCGCVDETLDLDLALTAINHAIKLRDDPRCYETRGQIYARQERWREAIVDLKRAVNGSLPDSRPAHATLAKALAAVGDNEAAKAHLRKAGDAD